MEYLFTSQNTVGTGAIILMIFFISSIAFKSAISLWIKHQDEREILKLALKHPLSKLRFFAVLGFITVIIRKTGMVLLSMRIWEYIVLMIVIVLYMRTIHIAFFGIKKAISAKNAYDARSKYLPHSK